MIDDDPGSFCVEGFAGPAGEIVDDDDDDVDKDEVNDKLCPSL